MKVIDPGHVYKLDTLDGEVESVLTFVKREGEKYPFNKGHHAGTNIQEVLRALIDRVNYVDRQIHYPENSMVIAQLRQALWLLESRAARTHGRYLNADPFGIEIRKTCPTCGHVECDRHKAA